MPSNCNKVAAGVGLPLCTIPMDMIRKISGRRRSSEPSMVSPVLLACEESSEMKLASSGRKTGRLLTVKRCTSPFM